MEREYEVSRKREMSYCSREELSELSEHILRHDEREQEAKERLICSHFDFARAKARKAYHQNAYIELEDYIAEAYMGLCEAARSYDGEKGAFTTYAGNIINNRLIDLWNRDGLALSRSTRQLGYDRAIDSAKEELSKANREITVESLVEMTNLSKKVVEAHKNPVEIVFEQPRENEDGELVDPLDRVEATADSYHELELRDVVSNAFQELQLSNAEIAVIGEKFDLSPEAYQYNPTVLRDYSTAEIQKLRTRTMAKLRKNRVLFELAA